MIGAEERDINDFLFGKFTFWGLTGAPDDGNRLTMQLCGLSP